MSQFLNKGFLSKPVIASYGLIQEQQQRQHHYLFYIKLANTSLHKIKRVLAVLNNHKGLNLVALLFAATPRRLTKSNQVEIVHGCS